MESTHQLLATHLKRPLHLCTFALCLYHQGLFILKAVSFGIFGRNHLHGVYLCLSSSNSWFTDVVSETLCSILPWSSLFDTCSYEMLSTRSSLLDNFFQCVKMNFHQAFPKLSNIHPMWYSPALLQMSSRLLQFLVIWCSCLEETPQKKLSPPKKKRIGQFPTTLKYLSGKVRSRYRMRSRKYLKFS